MKTASDVKEQNRLNEHGAVAAIDLALQAASHRGFYTYDEAVELLNRVVALIECPQHVESVLTVIDRAQRAVRGQGLVDRGQIVDVLLDLRLTLKPIAHDQPAYPLATRATGA